MRSESSGARRPLHAAAWLRAGVVAVAALAASLPQAALAASPPWNPSASARSAIEALVDDGGLQLTVSQWPLPRDAVQHALDAMPAELPPGLAAARALVQDELRAAQAGRIGLTLRGRRDALSGFGDDATPGSSLHLRSGELDGPHLALQSGGRLDPVADSDRPRRRPDSTKAPSRSTPSACRRRPGPIGRGGARDGRARCR